MLTGEKVKVRFLKLRADVVSMVTEPVLARLVR